MDKETEERLKKKIMANEELTEDEKKYFKDYDNWKIAHDRSRQAAIEGLRWNAWPFLFICAFFLLSTAFNNTKFLITVNGAADSSIWVTTVVSWVLGAASVVGSFWMKHKANELQKIAANAHQIELAEPEEEQAD